MSEVSITELRNNIKKYAKLAQNEDFQVTNRGEIVFYIKSPKSYVAEAIDRLKGAAETNIPYEDILKGKLKDL